MGFRELDSCVMNQRTNNRLCVFFLLAALCSFGASVAVQQEVQDFDFEDAASETNNIVKRSAALSDDEDLYLGDPTSTPVLTEEGSGGTSEPPAVKTDDWTWTSTATVKAPLVVDYPRYYRVIVNFTSIEYTPALADRTSQEFREIARVLQRDLEKLYSYVYGQHSVTILDINGSRSGVLVTFDIGSLGEASEDEIRNTLLLAVENRQIGSYAVSPVGFSFRAFESGTAHPCNVRELFCSANRLCISRVYACDKRKNCPDGEDEKYCSEFRCPSFVGRNPDNLPRRGNNWANLLINNVFPCDGKIVGWEYYRLIPEGSAYVGVWRQHVAESHFNLIAKTELPSAPVGIREVEVRPIPVKKGDFIGIFYPRSTPENVIAQATLADDVLSSNELYQNFHLEIYDEDIETQNFINLEDHDYKTINATFSLRAVMDYEVGPSVSVISRPSCTSSEFDCGDECIDISYRCDGQQDCNNNADEDNCSPQPLEPCLEGRFRCNDGTCIPRQQYCNGERNCPDGSDEFCTPCNADQFQCRNGQCVKKEDVCNAFPDCEDNSDEDPILCLATFPTVPPACPPGYNRCDDGTCLERCEGPMTCSSDQFRCSDGVDCFPNAMKCDGMPDCSDGADEIGCGLYITGPAVALVGERIRLVCNVSDSLAVSRYIHWYKDGTVNISALIGITNNRIWTRNYNQKDSRHSISELHILKSEMSDSGVYTCATDLKVSTGYTLIVVTKVFTCEENLFKCRDEELCIDQKLRCDGHNDCLDKSDEMECSCSVGKFQCRSGRCIDERRRCDTRPDCPDQSDEIGCTNKTTCNPAFFTCANGQCLDYFSVCDGSNDCGDNSDENNCPDCGEGEFKCANNACINNIRRCDGSDDCGDNSDEVDCIGCLRNQFECSDGTCISSSAKCNRVRDCSDASDELDCVCTTSEFRCANGQCIALEAKCDRRVDCYDRSDESDCPIVCRSNEFKCANLECIDDRLLCDGNDDCGDNSDEQHCTGCKRNQFQCNDGTCVSASARCNRVRECRDYSDEFDCVCTTSEFRCVNGQCISSELVCDGRGDCFDRSDESDCPLCRRNEFMCDDGKCFDRRYRCDRVQQCDDFSDEFNCSCNTNEFRCANGQCVPSSARCDRNNDCYDKSDEGDCLPACREDQFLCDNGNCIDIRRKCDGRNDCRDNSDEKNCPFKCMPGQFRCYDGSQCIDAGFRCDRRVDCSDRSDERNCPRCPPTKFLCDGRRCLDKTSVCNGFKECNDGTDELNCRPPTCSPDQFTCGDGECIERSRRCNRANDCRDGSDEINCPCRSGEWSCDGQCLPSNRRCNGQLDCSDGSDEQGCGVVIYVSPQKMTKRYGTSASFACTVQGDQTSRVVWIRRTGGAMPPQAVISPTRLLIPDLRIEDAGDYVCQAFGVFGKVEAHARLEVEFVGPPPNGNITGPCINQDIPCSNGQCLYKGYFCDGEADCTDGSDERNCPTLPCEPNEFRCKNGLCTMKIWRCDGDNDCGDRSDELGCDEQEPGSPCRASEFQCASGDQCIPFGYHCDGEHDCQDRSDEVGCSKPVIKTPPLPEITVEINGTFTIICEAIGVPTPLIVWRLNWGNIPTGSRVTVTSVNGYGNLTIRNAVPEDAGAYTCEAINNRGSIFAIPDANIIVRRTYGVCRTSTFNADAVTDNQCVKCFCFGQTQTCYSSNLQISQITLGNQVSLVRRLNLEPAEPGFVQYIETSRQFEIREFNRRLRTGGYYWSLPPQYLSKKLSSYGGTLSFQVYYEVDGFENPTSDPDIILIGNGITLFHRADNYERVDKKFKPKTLITVTIPLNESAWERSQGSSRGGPISQYATREDLMLVLENVTHILIRASYDNRQSLIRLGNVVLTTGVLHQTGLGRAVYVEECRCPAGYAGYSCEECAPGFHRVTDGEYGRRCVACRCNQHSNECDPISGICRNCRDNTAGPYCNLCADGYYGDPRVGACQPCPCPLTTSLNQFGRTCVLAEDREVTCNCPVGYTGRRCERCASGYIGNPQIPGERCRKRTEDVCDTRGSISPVPDPLTGQCNCKPTVTGPLCDTCKPETFYLSDANPGGCIPCFCMGVTQTCQSTTWHRVPITLSFTQSSSDVTLTDLTQTEKITEGFTVNRQNRELVYQDFDNYSGKLLYWSLPQQFLGNKVTAYGGNLRFTLRYTAGQDNTPVEYREPLVTIRGSEIDLEYRARAQVPERRSESFSVPLIESEWFTIDGNRVRRENFLMALAKLQHIFIRATFTTDTAESAISGISLDIAEDRVTSRERAYQVEQCVCPRGYKGLSCEDCDSGYTRTGTGLYLGLCEECRCNRHSSECDPETGVCKNCRHNTEGARCERCARGYYGDATRGSVTDCQKCPCPLTESPNQFSSDCTLDRDGQVTCTACPAGHTGRRCERCAPGYQGNPNRPGDYCKLINVSCECDGRGTVPNTVCDPETKQCQCKNNVQGLRCSSCRQGYFNLNRDLETGCMKCFCMGITNVCTSSNYYRDEIIPMFDSDGSHNFALVNARLSRTISDGFSVNAERSEITFDNFEGIQREQDSLYFNLPPKFRGDKVSSYGGFLRFSLQYTASSSLGRDYTDLDVVLISRQNQKLYHVFRPSLRPRQSNRYDIPLVESSFLDSQDSQAPSRETFLTVLADLSAILIRATYHQAMQSITLRDLRMDVAVPTLGRVGAPEVERCTCPEGYSGLSCQSCAPGFVRVEDSRTALGRCTRCSCNGHSNSCDPNTGVCQSCQHNTEGDRCERCSQGYYGDPSAGTPYDCRQCACPLTLPSNNFSPTCYLDTSDNRLTCDRCPSGYTGRDCGQCAPGFSGNPKQPGGVCSRTEVVEVTVTPNSLREPLGSTVQFQCIPRGRGPFNVVWSRLDGQSLPGRAVVGTGPPYELTISDLDYADSGRYVCTVTHPDGSSRGVGVLIVERPELPIKVRIEEPTQLIREPGQEAMFTCVAIQYSSAANYVLTWRKDGGQLPSKAVEQNGVLYIPNLNQNDVGTYTCTGSQRGSIDSATARIIFGEVPKSPTVTIEPNTVRVQEGQSVELICKVTGTPRPRVKWTKGNSNEPLPSHIITDEGRLFIRSALLTDRSAFHCHAENSEGKATARAVVYVSRAISARIFVNRANITGVIGQSEQLICQSDSPEVTLIWSREGGLPPGARQSNGVLTFSNIQPSYAGTYICSGTISTGLVVGRAVATLYVIGTIRTRPTARIEPERITIGSGTSGTLRCVVTGEPAPTITWSKVGGQLTSNHQVRGETLRILQASLEDRGRYICTATNVEGTVQTSVIVEIERREPPLVELYPDVSLTKKTGESAIFQCRVVQGQPAPTVTWTRAGGKPFTSRTEVRENGVLSFRDLTSEEQGEYICSSENAVGSVSATASLRVQGKPVIEITPGPNINVVIGQRVNIECIGIGDPTPSVHWRSQHRRRSDVLPETTDDGMATLTFDSISNSDAGRYICVARNTQGITEESVDVVVRNKLDDQLGVNIEGPRQLSLISGQSVELTCTPVGLPNPVITWRRANRDPLPPDHRVSNGVLYIPRITRDYAGEYICSLTSDALKTEYTASVFITVNVRPQLIVSPSSIRISAGTSLRLTCQPSGQGPFNIEWTKVDGVLSPQAQQDNGILEIRQVTNVDAGRYKCTATNGAGPSEAYSDVTVIARPTIERLPSYPSLYPYKSRIELRCDARGSPAPVIRWEKQSGNLPQQHKIRDGVLTIYDARPEDSGLYVCTASNEGGTAQISYQINIEGEHLGNILNEHNYYEGQMIELDCDSNVDYENATYRWSKVDGQISRHAMIGKRSLVFENVTLEDSGTYRCSVYSSGSVVHVDITINVQPVKAINYQAYTTAALGSAAQLRCDAIGSPRPVTWVKENGDLPSNHEVTHEGNLFIPKVQESDAGKYKCQTGQLVFPFYLVVGALVPYFSQSNENSYLEYGPLQEVYQDLDILLSFRPESTDGLLLYNGQYVADSGDFICFGLQQQVPEFRFDVGSGPAIIRGNRSLELNKWHTVQLKRNRRNGTLLVNDEPPYQGVAPGQHEGLDLGAPLYLGSVPDFNKIPRTVGYSRGFVGSVSHVQVKGVNLNLGSEAKSLRNVVQYDVCIEERPCLNGGTCRPFNVRFGYVCECAPGFMGEKCELLGYACSPGVCGSQGRCVDFSRQRYSCICPAPLAGDGCRRLVEISDPAFNRTSFISYPKISDGLLSVRISLYFNPRSLDDGIILYNALNVEGKQDFISLSIRNKYLEFRFDTGSGLVDLRSRQPLRAREWTRVIAERKGRDAMLIINNEEPVNKQVAANDKQLYPRLDRGDVIKGSASTNKTIGLNLHRPLYLGGVDPKETINPRVGVTSGFVGCIGELTIGEKNIKLIENALEMMNVQECGERNLCDRQPCKNNALCINNSPTEYICQCTAGFTGRNCESRIDICVLQTPCVNGGLCVSLQNNRYKCHCPLFWSGNNCERAVRIENSARFSGDGYIEIDASKYYRIRNINESLTVNIETTESDGLIVWQGQRPDDQKTSKTDFIALSLVDGYVQFSFEVGDGRVTVKSLNPVNDGYSHKIFIKRFGKKVELFVDQDPVVTVIGRGQLKVLNVVGNVFVGGVPDLKRYTASMYNKNFIGCVSNLKLTDVPINFGSESKGGLNVLPCN